ncbi:amidohydrolase [Thermaerobacter subterraneus DSM 13965]|uniref:Amidohydrolase n=2 Tax=Thermaerobacter TaxID=73918 RepID=K6NYY6_9FIRM|nr:amidohydrolase [Thermaerobacter subterraneus]EKP94065.1 amidohydrolase [Thermaerobacter subterraneus DSM 13965]
MAELPAPWGPRLKALFGTMVAWWRHLHQHPELSFQEVETPRFIAERLKEAGIPARTGVGGRGVVGVVEGARPGPAVALRADFDALPIQDEKDVPYRSQVPGVMHACGHDAHTATLLAVGRVLMEERHRLRGRVVLIHQFAEEVAPGGAKPMIEDGCLDGVDVIFGTHLWTPLPVGRVGYCPGYAMAAADRFEIEILGQGCHAAAPHQGVDPILVAAQVVTQLQQVVGRMVDPLEPAVVSVGTLHAGTAFNVIPETATLTGTVRTLSPAVRDRMEVLLERLVRGTCEAHGAGYRFRYERGYPALFNHEDMTAFAAEAIGRYAGAEAVERVAPVMGGEDFAYYLQKVPGCFFFTGAGNPEVGASYPHHHPRFDIDERAMLVAGRALLAVTLRYLLGDEELERGMATG